MRALITGMNGTVAPALAAHVEAAGGAVVAWNRTTVPPNDPASCRRFIADTAPDLIAHLAMGAPEWAGLLAEEAGGLGVPFVFTSTVSVYADRPTGPITAATPTDATSDYGRYKVECEHQVRAANPHAVIARLGWQIGTTPGSNTMTDHLTMLAAAGPIEASSRWFPACSFLEDTATVLYRLGSDDTSGTYLVDSNRDSSFFEIASGLSRVLDVPWPISETAEPVLDTRMVDERIDVPPLTNRLPR